LGGSESDAEGEPHSDGPGPTAPGPQRIGDYELLEVLGRGGMGVVYKARQTGANRIVAIKLIAAGDFASPELIRRFRSEAETAASLEHPGIVPVYEVGESDGRHFFSMQLIQGESLAARLQHIRRGTVPSIPEDRAARLVESMARAVHHAHQRGVLHRDIKPGNILLDASDEPRLTDFGLAKLLRHDSTVTRAGGVLGTPAYMSPEQAAGRTNALTTAVDVYGLGAVLYELLTGSQPFQAASSYELIRKVIEEEPGPPTSRNPRIGPDLETICLKCLEKEPSRRYATAQSLADDLQRWRNHEPISARRSGPGERMVKWSRRHPALAVLAAAFLLGSILFAQQQWRHTAALRSERDAARDAQRRAEHTVQNQRLVNADRLLQFGKTGEALAEWARMLRGNPSHPIAAARIFSTLSHRNLVLPKSGDSLLPFRTTTLEFSPDARYALRSTRDETALLDATTWEPLPNLSAPYGAVRTAWSPDGQRIAIVGTAANGLRILDARTLLPLLPVLPLKLWSVPVFTPDSSGIAVAGGEAPAVWLQDQRTGTVTEWKGDGIARRRPGAAIVHGSPRVLVPTTNAITSWPLQPGASPSPPHTVALPLPPKRLRTRPQVPTVVVETERSRFLFLDAESLETTWPEIPLETAIDDDFSPNSLIYASAQRERWGQLWNLATGLPLGEPILRPCLSPRVRFTPDGHSLVLFGDTPGTLLCEARNGRMPSRAFRHQAPVNHAEFSPDGHAVLTASDDRTAAVRDSETGALRFPPLEHPAKVRSAQFAARGTLIVTLDTENTVRIWDAISGTPRGAPRNEPNFVHAALVDSTGSWLACLRGAGWNLYSLTSTSAAPVLTESSHKLPSGQFTPDGQTLLTVTVTDAQTDLVQLWTPGQPKPRWTLPEREPYIRAAVSDDAKRVAVVGPSIRIWNTETSQPIGAPIPRTDETWAIAFSADGRRLLTAGMDRKAQIWDAQTGEPATEPMLHESGVWQAQFSPDGSRVLTSTRDGVARVWDAATGHPLTEPFPDHPVSVHIIMSPSTQARFSPDGTRVVLPCADHAARFIELPPSVPPPDWLPSFVEAIAGQRWGGKGMELLPWTEFYEARSRLESAKDGGPWLAWARWLLADRLERSMTPGSNRPTRSHVEDLVQEGSPDSLIEALQSEPDHPEALRKLARHWLDHPSNDHPGRARIAEHLLKRAAGPNSRR
jgi:serine/threonine protein kinase/WD40 repeat protein